MKFSLTLIALAFEDQIIDKIIKKMMQWKQIHCIAN
jgi:hypothetical protein